ncbi:MAG TPA: VWA domain-containing protein [Candidatus Acidoferrales bacterium]|nr:VWA domain-containing protein [Candidatus Acidoferrales bacterium]
MNAASRVDARWMAAGAMSLALAALMLVCGPACAQVPATSGPLIYKPPPKSDVSKEDTVRKDVNLVTVDVTVTDPYGRLVTGLDRENFRVYEDGKEQQLMRFEEDDIPISIGVVFDVSGSMSDKISKSRMAAVQFFKTANPADEFFLVDFADRAELATPFTTSVEELQNQLLFSAPGGMTALLDAVYLGMSEMKGARNARKALLIISDGGDNHSRYDEEDIKRFLRESDVQIYAVGIVDPDACDRTAEECAGPTFLQGLADMTGGRSFIVRNLDDLGDVATKISMELRNQYVLGYRPSDRKTDGKWRKIKVKLRPPRGLPPLTVYARYGYFAPHS